MYELEQNALMSLSGFTTRGVIYSLRITDSRDLHIPASWIYKTINPKSLATENQLKVLQQIVMIEILSKRDNKESIENINANLKSMNLPIIGPNFDIEIVGNNGGFVGAPQGATIKDDNHLYCLPCSTGRNQYEFGVMDLDK